MCVQKWIKKLPLILPSFLDEQGDSVTLIAKEIEK